MEGSFKAAQVLLIEIDGYSRDCTMEPDCETVFVYSAARFYKLTAFEWNLPAVSYITESVFGLCLVKHRKSTPVFF